MSRFTFDCPECSVETEVDDEIRSEILNAGCVLCRASVGSDDFSRIDAETTQ